MIDTRFTTVVEGVDDLLSVVDIEDIGDIETLLMVLFARPLRIDELWDDEGGPHSLEFIIHGNDATTRSVHEFPLSIIGLARSCAEMVDEVGPDSRGAAAADATPEVSAMNDDELIGALQQALGEVRLLTMMDDA
ncbi:hypothetical protein BN12_2620023 [Nostocoides japonicum T1-X7]|uniref:Uncharacterized protein n=1 Tax=Nostocoides japonicum T1-X7 TaxID=1194083 RepID=A0A077LW95_9MICO|nr:hypothetical protein [Tetrasphaera japonica]CCH78208.1 hypothetical protein BN12_2620023 [Tetrasphaera japonica T1-X7]